MTDEAAAPGESAQTVAAPGESATPTQTEELSPWARAEISKARKEAENLRARLKAAEPAVAKVQELEEASKSELQKAAEKAAEAEARAQRAELQVARDKIAREKGISDFAQFLQGNTEKEIAASADALLEKLPGRAPGRPVESLQSGAVPRDQQAPASVDDWIRASAHQR